jgi:DNA (cytosine-5)-methyltransferase 1
MHYYNDNDPKVCAWLRKLIAAGELPPGDVDCRSIVEVKAHELERYAQCHFFAGIGGWALALHWAGLEHVAGIWTGSCPCQPLSCAGKRKGHADERHLWPAFHNLIAECRPSTVFGEQFASADGREWFAGVRLDLEELGYACGGADLCAAGVGAPHRRQRLFWVADMLGAGLEGRAEQPAREELQAVERSGDAGRVADAGHQHLRGGTGCEETQGGRSQSEGAGCGATGGVDDTSGHRTQQQGQAEPCSNRQDDRLPWQTGAWSAYDILPCRDGKARRVESGTFPLAHGVPGRVGLLRGYGNAIVPQVAEVFVRAWLETLK